MLHQEGAMRVTEKELLLQILELEPGWWSELTVSWELGGNDPDERRAIRQAINSLVKARVLRRASVKHRDNVLACVYIDHLAIRDRLDAVAV